MRTGLIVAAGVLLTAGSGSASTIVAIRTPDVVVIAADSLGTVAGAGTQSQRSVCKIHRADRLSFAVAGISNDEGRGFSVVDTVRKSIGGHGTVRDASRAAAEAVRHALGIELSRLELEDRDVFERTLSRLTSVILTGLDPGDVPAAAGFHFERQLGPAGAPSLRAVFLACPGDCPGGVYTFFLGERSAIDKYISEHGKSFSVSPEEGALLMVETEVRAGTPGVGGPVDVLRAAADGTRWVRVKPECSNPAR